MLVLNVLLRMPMLSAFTDYYEATNDKRVIPSLTKYFDYQFKTSDKQPLIEWAKTRAADNVEVIVWLYSRAGDKFLLK